MPFSDAPRRRLENSQSSLITPHKPVAPARDGTDATPPPPRPSRSARPSLRRTPTGFSRSGGPSHKLRVRRRWLIATVLTLAALSWWAFKPASPNDGTPMLTIRRGEPIELPPPVSFPEQDTVRTREGRWVTRYTPDEVLQARAERWVNQYRPEGAVVVVSDLRTGVIRALVERDSSGTSSRPRLALGTTFPAASLAKIVTAAAALEGGIYRPQDDLPLLGGAYTLYRSQLRVPSHGRHPTVTLREAFARSINPTFGVLGQRLGPEPLRDMAMRMGFNQPSLPNGTGRDDIRTDLDLDSLPTLQARLTAPDSGFHLAEVASGFTTATTLSPLHALRIARAIGQDGRLLPARFTLELHSLDNGRTLVLPEPPAEPFASPGTLRNLRSLMEATVASGTARRGFRRNMTASDIARLDMGGKTGSLNGHNPPGRYEWFIGYARHKEHPEQGIAVAVMLINRTYLAVHATELAGLVIRDWARYSAPYADEDGKYLAGR